LSQSTKTSYGLRPSVQLGFTDVLVLLRPTAGDKKSCLFFIRVHKYVLMEILEHANLMDCDNLWAKLLPLRSISDFQDDSVLKTPII
jgi:hypothetical protein